jgi:hypothetical protein
MNDEMEEGNIDESGYYVFNKRNNQYSYYNYSDPWYDSVKDDIAFKEKKEYLNKKRDRGDHEPHDSKKNEAEEEDKDFAYYGEEDLYYKDEKLTQSELNEIKDEVKVYRLKLLPFLNDDETVIKAIKRITPKKQQLKGKKAKLDDQPPEDGNFEELLGIVSKLTELSYFDVYNDTIEKIQNAYGKQDLAWKYRMCQLNNDEKKEYGTFTTEQMREWHKKVKIL